MQAVQKVYMTLLLLLAITMLLWGIAGFYEYLTGKTIFIPLQNEAYPSGVQFMHWLLLTLFGTVFTIGYLKKWKYTPIVSLVLFSNLAVLCTIETFDFMSDQWGIVPYLTEIIMYVINSTFLLLSPISKNRFKKFD